ncbi:MAG: hypothetical protein M3Y57_15405 [Acidobacteriota bacterium]|nr:hypothetical protein [Acidobacteriota bacterium]
MARSQNFDKEVLTRLELQELAKRLSAMDTTSVRDFYAAAYCGCKPDTERVPKARYVQELVTAWKQMRFWYKSVNANCAPQPDIADSAARPILGGGGFFCFAPTNAHILTWEPRNSTGLD